MFLDTVLISLVLILSYMLFKYSKTQSLINVNINKLNRSIEKRSLDIVQSEHQFKTFFDEIAIPACIFNVHTMRFIQVNKELCSLLEYSKEELLEANLKDLIISADYESSIDAAYDNSQGNSRSNHINRYITKSQNIVDINWIFSDADSKGNCFCIAAKLEPTFSKN